MVKRVMGFSTACFLLWLSDGKLVWIDGGADPGQQISFPAVTTEREFFPQGTGGQAFWMEGEVALLCLP